MSDLEEDIQLAENEGIDEEPITGEYEKNANY